MKRTGRLTRDGTRGPARRALRAHVAAYVFVVIISTGLLTSGLLGAPLVSVLLIGILLVCPLLMWVPFRFERKAREQLTSRGRNKLR